MGAAALAAAGAWWWWGARGPGKGLGPSPAGERREPEGAGRAPAPEGEVLIDPREIRFPRSLSPAAREKLDQAIEHHVSALDAYFAREAAWSARAAAALRLYEEAGALVPELGQLHHLLVVETLKKDQGRAMSEAERWLERFPDAMGHLETLGIAEYLRGRVAASLKHLERASALDPRSLVLKRRLAEVYSAQGSKDAALGAAAAALRLIGYPAPSSWSHREAEATVRVALKTYHRFYEYSDLLPIAEDLLRRFPGDPMALVAAGVARCELGDYAGAEKVLARVVDDPDNGDQVRFELGIAILKQGRPREAAAVLAALLERSPHFTRGYYQLGQCLARLGRGEAADAMFRMARSLAPSDRELRREIELRGAGKQAEARRARAKALVLRGQFREAEAALRDPELRGNPAAAVYLAEFLVDSFRASEVEDALRPAARVLGEAHPDVQGWRARALALSGRFREAAALLEPLGNRRYPGNPWPQALGSIYLEDLEDPQAAIPWLERALSDPPQAAELAALARARLWANDPAGARKLLEPINQAEPEWEDQVRLLLALSVLRSEKVAGRALELIEGTPPAARTGRLYHLALAEMLESSADPLERERAARERSEEARHRELEGRWRALRSEIAALRGPEAAASFLAASRLRLEMGDRPGSIRLARLAAAARPDLAEAHRFLAERLDDPGEVFYRLEALRHFRSAAPQDPAATRMEDAARKEISF